MRIDNNFKKYTLEKYNIRNPSIVDSKKYFRELRYNKI